VICLLSDPGRFLYNTMHISFLDYIYYYLIYYTISIHLIPSPLPAWLIYCNLQGKLLPMNIFEESFRTISTRDIILSQDQMDNFRIKKIFNSAGDPEFLNDFHAVQMLENFNKRGEFCLLEAINEGKIYKISLITFHDIWSKNMFALMNWDIYEGFPELLTLYN